MKMYKIELHALATHLGLQALGGGVSFQSYINLNVFKKKKDLNIHCTSEVCLSQGCIQLLL